MPDITKRATFYAARKPRPKMFHVEVDGAIVNITVGLTDDEGHLITRVDVIPDGPLRGGDGQGRMWVQPDGDARVIRLHDWERAPGIPRDCHCMLDDRSPRELVTCGTCERKWCDRCTPTPAARCPFEYDHEG